MPFTQRMCEFQLLLFDAALFTLGPCMLTSNCLYLHTSAGFAELFTKGWVNETAVRFWGFISYLRLTKYEQDLGQKLDAKTFVHLVSAMLVHSSNCPKLTIVFPGPLIARV